MFLSGDMALLLLQEALRSGNLTAANALGRSHPVLRTTRAYDRRRVAGVTKRSNKIRRFIGVEQNKAKLLLARPAAQFAMPSRATMPAPKKRFKAHNWWWDSSFVSRDMVVYRRGAWAGKVTKPCCSGHDAAAPCVVCRPTIEELTVELPPGCTPDNTVSVRQWMRCHKLRYDLTVEFVYCIPMSTVSGKRWDLIADAAGPTRVRGGRGVIQPSLLPCYKHVDYEMELLH